MEERRRLKRKYLAFFTRVFDEKNGELLGHLADITADGMMIISTHALPTEQTFKMSMDLPEYVFGKDHLTFKGNSIWCSPDIDPTFWNIGFKFVDVKAETVAIIDQIIQEYGIRD